MAKQSHRGLYSRVIKMKDQLWVFEKRVNKYSMNIDPNKMATTLAIEEENEFATEWFAPEDQKGVYFEEINLEKELLSEEENSITTYSPGVPKQPSQPSAKGEHLTLTLLLKNFWNP